MEQPDHDLPRQVHAIADTLPPGRPFRSTLHRAADDKEQRAADALEGAAQLTVQAEELEAEADVIIVDDGAERWGADRAALFAAMAALGWRRRGSSWIEPEAADGDEADAYTALCERVQPLPGYDVGDASEQWAELPTIRCTAEDHRVWTVR